jgi:solute carrier family 25 (mitochondrial carnitine/acylcarnitine transporter), member 20/29
MINLAGFAPNHNLEWASTGKYTLLCPTNVAFQGLKHFIYWDDVAAMKKLVSQHLIPSPSSKEAKDLVNAGDTYQPVVITGKATYSTLLSRDSLYGDIIFRQKDEKSSSYLVGIKDARGTNGENDWANVVAWGRTTKSSSGGVIQIDRVLFPYQPSWWIEYAPPLLVGVVLLGLMGGFFWGVRWLWRRDTLEATYEPIGGFDRDDDDS